MKDFTLKIIAPDRVFYEGQVDSVEFNTSEGEIGILPGHEPTTVIVRPGVLVIDEGETEKTAALHEGFAEILQDGVTILAEIVEWPEEIDLERAEEAKQRAEARLQSKGPEVDVVRAESALRRAVARINVLK